MLRGCAQFMPAGIAYQARRSNLAGIPRAYHLGTRPVTRQRSRGARVTEAESNRLWHQG